MVVQATFFVVSFAGSSPELLAVVQDAKAHALVTELEMIFTQEGMRATAVDKRQQPLAGD